MMIVSVRKMATIGILTLLAGCVTAGSLDNGPGSALAKRLQVHPHTAGLKKQEIRKAVRAELKALETALPGATISWKGTKGTSGEIKPGQAFEISGRTCRLLDHMITVGGITGNLSTTACRIEKGNWEPVG